MAAKEIKIIDDSGIEIKPTKDLVVLPKKDGNEYITKENAEQMLENLDTVLTKDAKRIIKGQLLLIEAEKVVSKTGDGKCPSNSRKTGCEIRGTE